MNYTCTAEEREVVVNRSIAVLLYEYYETLDDVAETGTVSSVIYIRTVITFSNSAVVTQSILPHAGNRML